MLVIRAQGWSRFNSYIGNVLGTAGTHSVYEISTGATASDGSNFGVGIYCIGYSLNCTADTSNYDTITLTSAYRWGNYDVVNGARFETAEVPSGQFVPSSQTLPNSLYLSAKPAWFGAQPWPAIGPDVTGQGEPDGHTGTIPAKACYQAMGGPSDGSGGVLSFNADSCYPGSTSKFRGVSGGFRHSGKVTMQ
jgi:hypothetical protein